jgi:hypothetical protein
MTASAHGYGCQTVRRMGRHFRLAPSQKAMLDASINGSYLLGFRTPVKFAVLLGSV